MLHEVKKIGKIFKNKFVGTGPSSYKKRIYRAAVPQRLRNSGLHWRRNVGWGWLRIGCCW